MKYRCRYCKNKVEADELSSKVPQVCKSIDCIKKKYDEFKEKIHAKARVNLERERSKEKKTAKEKLKTHKDYLKDLQKVFNEYIRKRDLGKPCISCDSMTGKRDAGHMFTVGGNPELRFDEDNVHSQCVYCNQHQHGSVANYMLNLPKRIGQDRYDALLERRGRPNKLTTLEIKEKIKHYKEKIKELGKEPNDIIEACRKQ